MEDINLSPHFKKSEWWCSAPDDDQKPCPYCGGQYILHQELVDMAESFREHLNEKFKGKNITLNVHCVNRCPGKNDAVAGEKVSLHLRGMAMDCHSPELNNDALHKSAVECHKPAGILRGGLGFYGWGIHFDIGKFREWGNK